MGMLTGLGIDHQRHFAKHADKVEVEISPQEMSLAEDFVFRLLAVPFHIVQAGQQVVAAIHPEVHGAPRVVECVVAVFLELVYGFAAFVVGATAAQAVVRHQFGNEEEASERLGTTQNGIYTRQQLRDIGFGLREVARVFFGFVARVEKIFTTGEQHGTDYKIQYLFHIVDSFCRLNVF